MNGKTNIETSQAKARRCQRSRAAGASRRFKQRGLYDAIRHGNKTALRRCHAIQPEQQRGVTGFMAVHERETGLDFIGCAEQGQGRIDRPLLAGANSTGAAAQQGKLVRPDMVCAGQHQRAGSLSAIVAEGCLCPLETTSKAKSKTETAATGNAGRVLPECSCNAKSATSEKHNVLSVGRINRPLHISVHRTKGIVRISVHRTYERYFLGFPLSVQRTPSSNTTPYMKGIEHGTA